MSFLPSLLEYSKKDFVKKLQKVKKHSDKFLKLTKQDKLSLHLDFVLPEFAVERQNFPSLSLYETFEELEKEMGDTEVYLDIHLMGTNTDLNEAAVFFTGYEMPDKWSGIVYVPEKRYGEFEDILNFDVGNDFETGVWYDLDEWKNKPFPHGEFSLLMTVKAGKSGQKLVDEVKSLALEKVTENPGHKFVLDGGWSVDFLGEYENLKIVSYSDFWKKFK